MSDATASVRLIGPGSLIQGTIPADRRWRSLARARRLEAVVLTPDGGTLVHYHRDQTRPDRPWVAGEAITRLAAGPGILAQGPGRGGRPGSLHVLVPESSEGAVTQVHYVRAGLGWRQTPDPWPFGPPGGGAFEGGARDLMATAVTTGASGWRMALVQEGRSVYQWQRQEARGAQRWVRAACLRFDPGDDLPGPVEQSRKLAQVTGERDTQPSCQDETLSSSLTRSGVRGTDLGVRFDHAGRAFLLFGDTHWTNPGRATLDAIGEVTPTGPVPGLPGVEIHGAPLLIRGGPATTREYDVPLDAFSLGRDLYVFYTSHHFDRRQVMGRSLLTRVDDPTLPISGAQRRRGIALRYLGVFSDLFFINVSAVRRGDVLYVWGSGSYRADDLRLAALDLTEPALLDALQGRAPWRSPQVGVRYFAGLDADARPRWSAREDDAEPILPGAFGELSVRWSDAAGCYLLLAMEGPEDPLGHGVTLRAAALPWGPWTPRRRLFDWVSGGKSEHDEASRFIRAHHAGDPVGDAIFSVQRAMTGAAYAPYIFDTAREGGDVVLRYTLSTWNPYQVVLMEHRLAAADLIRG